MVDGEPANHTVNKPERRGKTRIQEVNVTPYYESLQAAIEALSNPSLTPGEFNNYCVRKFTGNPDELAGYLDLRTIAQTLRIDYKTVYRELQRGNIPASRVGKWIWRVPGCAIWLYADVHRVDLAEGSLDTSGDLSKLRSRMGYQLDTEQQWTGYVVEKLGSVPEELSWEHLVGRTRIKLK